MPRVCQAAITLLAFAALCGCVADDTLRVPSRQKILPPDGGPQPRMASYTCPDGSMLTVENRSAEIVMTVANGEPVTLPAAPENQRSRYGAPGYALVLDGPEALYMKGGKPPLNCRR